MGGTQQVLPPTEARADSDRATGPLCWPLHREADANQQHSPWTRSSVRVHSFPGRFRARVTLPAAVPEALSYVPSAEETKLCSTVVSTNAI